MGYRYELRFSGSGGQGMITAGVITAEAAAIYDGKKAVQSQSFGTSTSPRLQEGRDLVKEVRATMLESARDRLSRVIKDIVGVGVTSLHTDISTNTGERMIIFTLEESLDKD